MRRSASAPPLGSENLSQWMDWRHFMDFQFAQVLADLTRYTNGLDSYTPAGFVGGQQPSVYLAPTFREIQGPAGQFIVNPESYLETDPIALYYSHPSVRVSRAMDSATNGAAWPKRSASIDDENLSSARLRLWWCTLPEDFGVSMVEDREDDAPVCNGDRSVSAPPPRPSVESPVELGSQARASINRRITLSRRNTCSNPVGTTTAFATRISLTSLPREHSTGPPCGSPQEPPALEQPPLDLLPWHVLHEGQKLCLRPMNEGLVQAGRRIR